MCKIKPNLPKPFTPETLKNEDDEIRDYTYHTINDDYEDQDVFSVSSIHNSQLRIDVVKSKREILP